MSTAEYLSALATASQLGQVFLRSSASQAFERFGYGRER